ncbi:hypothetical protein EIN_053530 [Entamoeba invadens IP1]|uniref:hypothetical protein n=1 Tax=Entamoeba invadens IP1 TaxID=370355 RepID=UPI0002C3E440|nr:hypothetical protein EIN_053530 [Entamoeba invadens IP1]ELP93108.1 hypothetical protein EIN_053530 [Entamoeba invadens IP1]|eukprot:XP_004259879.1 hypothetical protein EIN_053530 [Entamoeba invadens IP1]
MCAKSSPHIVMGCFKVNVGEDKVTEVLSKYVEVASVDIRCDTANGKSLGVAIVTLKNSKDLQSVLKVLNETKDLFPPEMMKEKTFFQEWSPQRETELIVDYGDFSRSSSKIQYSSLLKMKVVVVRKIREKIMIGMMTETEKEDLVRNLTPVQGLGLNITMNIPKIGLTEEETATKEVVAQAEKEEDEVTPEKGEEIAAILVADVETPKTKRRTRAAPRND